MAFTTHTETLSIKTKKRLAFVTITPQVERIVAESGVREGVVVVQSHHTTARIWVNEDEKNLVGCEGADIHRALDRFASPDDEYGHNDVRDSRNPSGKRDTHLCRPDEKGECHECANGHAHAQALMLPHSATFVVHKGWLVKGEWQEVMLVELDHDRDRTVSVHVQGKTS